MIEEIRAVHNAAVRLGARCDSNCRFWDPSVYKSHNPLALR
jgi:hypothetical protein